MNALAGVLPSLPDVGHDRPAGHGHLWLTRGGVGLHAPPGELVRDEATGKVCCHLCGRWFTFLGGHVRVHGHDAASYRELAGLCKTRALASYEFSATVSARQKAKYATQPAMRGRLSSGQEMARSGQLSWQHQSAHRVARNAGFVLERRRGQMDQLSAGRAAMNGHRAQQQAERLAELGFDDLVSYLRHAHSAGASLETLALTTGLGRAKLRQALESAQVTPRPPGVNTTDGKRSRARSADAKAAQRLGTSDLSGWLLHRRAEGWSMQRLADAVGHSLPWVRNRLAAAPLRSLREITG